jgi:hypothetical protein
MGLLRKDRKEQLFKLTHLFIILIKYCVTIMNVTKRRRGGTWYESPPVDGAGMRKPGIAIFAGFSKEARHAPKSREGMGKEEGGTDRRGQSGVGSERTAWVRKDLFLFVVVFLGP